MANHTSPRRIDSHLSQRYGRLVLKGFGWEIVRGETDPTIIRQSSETFETMEGAHTHGSVVLERMQGPK
jgi:hypothetical protein